MKRLSFVLVFSLIALLSMAQAKYVFFFIGDGMGAHQVLSTEMYLAELEGRIGRKSLLMTTFPYTGQVATFSASNGVTDSAASGTCLASGKKTDNGMIGQTADGTPAISVASRLKQQGWGVGIMTTVTIDHATPSAHYAHTPSRDNYYMIGTQLAESGFDFFVDRVLRVHKIRIIQQHLIYMTCAKRMDTCWPVDMKQQRPISLLLRC